MNILETFKQKREEARGRRVEQEMEALAFRAEDKVQVKLYEGNLYIAIDGTPILDVQELREPENVIGIVEHIRSTVVTYECSEHRKRSVLERGGLR